MNDAARASAMDKLHVAQIEASSVQNEIDQVHSDITKAAEAGDRFLLAILYRREADLLRRKSDAMQVVAAIAAELWLPD